MIPLLPRSTSVLERELIERIAYLACPLVEPCPVTEAGATADEWAALAGLGQTPHEAMGERYAALQPGHAEPMILARMACQRLADMGTLERADPGYPIRYRPGPRLQQKEKTKKTHG